MTRIILGVEYDGSGFSGWQWQASRRTVQQVLERALSKVADQKVSVICAGRTDAGVHAFEQIAHFDVNVERDLHSWMLGGNSNLPDDVRIIWAKEAVADFHARYSAIARFYRYIIVNRPVKSALLRKQATWCYVPLDAERMHQAGQYLIGNHDFSSFRAQGCQSKSPFRVMYFIDVYRNDEKVIIDIAANAFLHHMVRNIAGVLMDIGTGKRPVDWAQHLLEVKNRELGGATAAPDGLYLGAVYYPEQYGIQKHPVFNKLPADAKRFD
ncbi:pseudouridylate synthase I [Candidatus Methylobacter favarea]|uniref:tRNA pseudouridine synthase A n=1 Tax=Candidatus Methylobacter favarea TaxID=2707345 RepID=A0A8S0X9X1_9GAMM|nr:tRNA pseudouridine(38-40) synthase TruA [Candidatus Methylobacter favarea]CAA9892766.1 pseudouridylate synthase I [Candidatus Methylobacter favarea]